jgi:AcrR family transcriptional regulator
MGSGRRSAAGGLPRNRARPGVRDSVSSPRVQVLEMQRARLLNAAVVAVEELGYTCTTVAHITARARVSRRTFYDLFANREECLLAVLEEAVAQVASELAADNLDSLAWRERVRMGLWRILCFFDREPELARVCVVQSARASQRILERREELLAALAGVIDQGRHETSRGKDCPALVAEGLVGATLSILYSRLLGRQQPQQLSGLLGELMGMIVLPYLGSAAARRERTRPLPPSPSPQRAADLAQLPLNRPEVSAGEIPMRLTYRTARVLEDVATHPGASNRAIAEHAGISDQGQVSKLLARLERLGLLRNTGDGHVKGEPNAWQLTPAGLKVTQSVSSNGRYPQRAA